MKNNSQIENSFLYHINKYNWNHFNNYLNSQIETDHTEDYYGVDLKNETEFIEKLLDKCEKNSICIDKSIYNQQSNESIPYRPKNPIIFDPRHINRQESQLWRIRKYNYSKYISLSDEKN